MRAAMDEEREKEERRYRAACWQELFGKAETAEEVEERTKRQRARKGPTAFPFACFSRRLLDRRPLSALP